MDETFSFRGLAGEVVNQFVRPGLLLTSIPVFVFWILFGVVFFFLGQVLPSLITFLALLVAGAYLLARFAIPASRGHFNAGFFNDSLEKGEALNYAIRYGIISLAWLLPVALLTWLSFGSLFDMARSGMSGGQMSLMQGGFHGFMLALIAVICMVAPTITTLITLRTQAFTDLLSAETWGWLWYERRDDLIPFFTNILGGLITFWMFFSIPLILIVVIAFNIYSGFGMVMAFFAYLLPIAVSPILLGRLAGAFVYADEVEMMPEAFSPEPTAVVTKPSVGSTPTPITPSSSTPNFHEVRLEDYTQLVQEISVLTDEAANTALRNTLVKQGINRSNLALPVKLAHLYKKTNQVNSTKEQAVSALKLALEQRQAHVAALLLKDFLDLQIHQELPVEKLQQLSEVLLAQQHFVEASLCVYFADKEQAQPVLSIAEAASQAGQSQAAYTVYNFFVRKFPDSNFAEYARDAAEAEKLKRQQ